MGICCCKQDDQPYFVMKNNTLVRNKQKHKKNLSDVYKRYAKKKCFICDDVKYGRQVNVVYGEEFICIDCVIDKNKNKKEQHNHYKTTGRYN